MRLLAALACGLTLVCFAVAPALAAGSSLDRERRQDTRIHDLRKDVDENEKIISFLLIPVTVLVGILSIGGAIGVVFSIRDQRRVSQLHELNVAGEMSSQRRTEQSYGSFFEQSQTTLSLVNETLQLAKEATAQAAKSMDEKAQIRVDAIEEKAQKLMLELFNTHEFDIVVVDPGRRRELQEIAKELGTLEGYLSLQNIKLGDYAKFIKAIDQFIEGETEAALSALQLASQDPVVGDLQKFIEYWVGYILTTVGQYGEAIERFRHDELDLPKTSSQYVQLERIIVETEFFLIAKPKPQGERNPKSKIADTRSPQERFRAVAMLFDRLTKLDEALQKSGTQDDQVHTQLEVARTQADIFEWIAYDPKHLDEPIPITAVEAAREIVGEPPAPLPKKAEELIGSKLWDALDEPDEQNLFRCWALLHAQEICSHWEQSSADVAFALAECHFKLQNSEAPEEFSNADNKIHEEMGEHREQRHDATLLQSLLICHCRLLKLQEEEEKAEREKTKAEAKAEAAPGNEEQREHAKESEEFQKKEDAAIRSTQREVLDAVKKMGRGRVTIFSQIQRRNLTQEEFKTEVAAIVTEMRLRGSKETEGANQEEESAAEAS